MSRLRKLPKDFTSLSLLPHWVIFTVLVCVAVPGPITAQIYSGGNHRPRIKDQRALSTFEEQPITVQLTDLTVEDRDDLLYPIGFSMELYPGSYYTFSGTTVTPDKDFAGTLTVPVTVNDGEDNSDKYNLQITVVNINDAPVITGQQSLSFSEDTNYQMASTDLIIADPDDNEFTLDVAGGTN
jgi:hypothetical protein